MVVPSRRAVLATLLAAVVAGGLSACGRKGKLEPPPSDDDQTDEPEGEDT